MPIRWSIRKHFGMWHVMVRCPQGCWHNVSFRGDWISAVDVVIEKQMEIVVAVAASGAGGAVN